MTDSVVRGGTEDREKEPELYRLRRENALLRAELEAAKRSAADLHNRIRELCDEADRLSEFRPDDELPWVFTWEVRALLPESERSYVDLVRSLDVKPEFTYPAPEQPVEPEGNR